MSTILLANGRYFDLLNPVVYPSDIDAIAHALAHTCRFAGHTREFYSVAQHSVLVASLMPPGLELIGLLHDAAEAFVGDVSTPLKALLPDYKEIERRVQYAVYKAFNLTGDSYVGTVCQLMIEENTLRKADLIALATEKRDLMPESADVWPCLEGVEPSYTTLKPWSSTEKAKMVFLDTYRTLTKKSASPPDDRQALLDHIEELQQQLAGYQAEVALLKDWRALRDCCMAAARGVSLDADFHEPTTR